MYPAIKVALPKSGIVSIIDGDIKDGPYHYMDNSRSSLLVEQLFRANPLEFIIRFCIEDLVMGTEKYKLLRNMLFSTISKYINSHSWVYAVIK